jgi:hypothetical protein
MTFFNSQAFLWAVPAAAHAHIASRVQGLGNVLLATWVPQLRILQHAKVRCFVSHGGGKVRSWKWLAGLALDTA